MQLLAILIYSVLLGTLVSTAGAAGVNSTCRQDPRARSDFCGARSAELAAHVHAVHACVSLPC